MFRVAKLAIKSTACAKRAVKNNDFKCGIIINVVLPTASRTAVWLDLIKQPRRGDQIVRS